MKIFLISISFFLTFVHVADAALLDAVDVLGQSLSDGSHSFIKNGIFNSPNNEGYGLTQTVTYLDSMGHRMFVLDPDNSRVLVYNLNENNVLIDRYSDYVLGQTGFDQVIFSSTPNSASFSFSSGNGLAYDNINKFLFVSDQNNNRILVFDLSDGITNGMNASYVLGQNDFESNGEVGNLTGLWNPKSLEYDSVHKRLFVAQDHGIYHSDYPYPIVVYDLSSGISNGMAHSWALGGTLCGETGYNPGQLSYDYEHDHLFVVSQIIEDRIIIYDTSSLGSCPDVVGVIGGERGGGASNFQLTNVPSGVAYEPQTEMVYVSDSGNNRVLAFDVSVSFVDPAVYVLGQPDFVTYTADVVSGAVLNSPGNLTIDDGNHLLYVGDVNSRVLVFDISTVTNGENAVDVLGQIDLDGNPIFTKSGINNSPNGKGFSDGNKQMALDSKNHRLFFADQNSNRVLVWNLDSDEAVVNRIPDFVIGQDLLHDGQASGGSSGMQSPNGVAYDESGDRLFVSDSGNNRILVYDGENLENGQEAINVLGQQNFDLTDPSTSQSTLSNPKGLAYDPELNLLFVSDTGNNRILIFNVADIENGESAINVIGQGDFSTSDAATSQTGLTSPFGISIDYNRRKLFVDDVGNGRVIVFDVSTISNGMAASNVIGQSDFDTVEVGAGISSFGSQGLFVDSDDGLLYVCDGDGNRILVFDVSTISNGMAASNVIGQLDFDSSDSGTSKNKLYGPRFPVVGLTSKKLFITDQDNYRIIVIQLPRIKDSFFSNAKLDEMYNKTLEISGGNGSYACSLVSGILPQGLALNENDCVVSGIPVQAGNFAFSIKAEDESITSPGESGLYDIKSFNLIITESLPQDQVPPVISNPSPSSGKKLNYNTKSKSISINTNENAVCRYDFDSGIPFSSMDNTFSETGGTFHKTVIGGLKKNKTYYVHIKCQDELMNANDSDFLLKLTVEKENMVIRASKKVVSNGENVPMYGKNFRKKRLVKIYLKRYSETIQTKLLKTDSKGSFSIDYSVENMPKGVYRWYVRDMVSGKNSKSVRFSVK